MVTAGQLRLVISHIIYWKQCLFLRTSQQQLSTEGMTLSPSWDFSLAQSQVCLGYWDLELEGKGVAAKHNIVCSRVVNNELSSKAKGVLLRSSTAGVPVPHPQARDAELGEGNTCVLWDSL